VVCLQELKATDAEFPQKAIRRAGYDAIWRGQKTWNGVAILARGMQPVVTRTELPGDPSDTQSRYIEAAVNGTVIGAFTYRMAIRSQARNSLTSWRGSSG
jgi:exodeoxyribonuclease-3